MAYRIRSLAITLITLNSLGFLLCAGSLAYQIVGDRAGSLIASKNSIYNQGITELLLSCSSFGYPEKKYEYLYLQLSVANVGLLVAVLANLIALFFSVGLFGTTKQPQWKYCSMPSIRIKATLYCMFALSTLLTATFTGFLIAPYFYISSFTCSAPSAITYQSSLLIEVALGGASFLVALICMILTFFIKSQHATNLYADKVEETEMVPLGDGNNKRAILQPTDGNGMMTNEDYPEQNVLQFQMTKNPLASNDPRDNGTINYNGMEMADLQESMLDKNQREPEPEQEPEPGPLKIPHDPFLHNYQGGGTDSGASNSKRLRRNRLQTGNTIRNTIFNNEANRVPTVNPFMVFVPEKPLQPNNKQDSAPTNKRPPTSANHQKPGFHGQPVPNSGQMHGSPNRRLKSHPKLESSMKSSKYVDNVQYFMPEVRSSSGIPSAKQQIDQPPAQVEFRLNQRQVPADSSMTLMNELNNMNFVDGNQVNNTYGVIHEDVSGSQVNEEQSMNIGVSQVLHEAQATSRRFGMTPL